MAGSKSDALANSLLDHVYGGPDYTRLSPLHVRLYTVAPTHAGGGTEVDEAVWTNYEPVSVVNNDTNFPAASGQVKSNGVAIDFGTAAITGGPVVVVAFSICTQESGDNMLGWGPVTPNKTINNGDGAKFPIGSLTITES
jgi:hypothetical protein